MEIEEKMEALQTLAEEWNDCRKCPRLCDPVGRRRGLVVFGEGNPDADLVIIGEAPGEREDRTGSPFQGRSGEIIDMFLSSLQSSRDEVFITNVVGCRPTEDEDPKANRKPEKDEIAQCADRVSRILQIVDPYVVLLLGASAVSLVQEKVNITKLAEDAMIPEVTAVVSGVFSPVEWPAFATYHPSYLLRNWDMRKGGPVEKAYNTFAKAFAVADMYAELYEGRIRAPRTSEGNEWTQQNT